MEWAIVPILVMALVCPLMMAVMVVGGWIFGRRVAGHDGHNMMGCMGHGHTEDRSKE